MSSYCDTCDNTMKETTSYLVDGQRFNYCAKCVQGNGYQGKEVKQMIQPTKCKTCDEQINPAEHEGCNYCDECCHELQMSWQVR